MVGCPLPHRPARFSKMGSAFPDFRTVQIGCVSKSRPYGVDWMGFQRTIDFQLPRNHCRPSTRINHPARSYIANFFTYSHTDFVFAFSTQFEILHFGRTPQIAPRLDRLLQNRFVQFCAVELKCRQTGLVFRADFRTTRVAVIAISIKPHSQPGLDNLLVS